MKKIGIVMENYKADKFKAALTEKGYDHTSSPLGSDLTAIFILVLPEEFTDKVLDIGKICRGLQINFHLPKN